jgi:low temperature requirement protein LtrA
VPAVADGNLAVVTVGYVVMRLSLVGQWLRVARSAPEFRRTALWYAVGISSVQLLWVGRLFLPEDLRWPAFGVLVVAELAVPLLAERQGGTPWHPHHIAERYGLFTIIVLGEAILGVTNAFSGALDEGGAETSELVLLAVAGAVVVFALWWLYFDEPAADVLTAGQGPWPWAYGHYWVFAAVAAVGAGLEVAIDADTGRSEAPELVAGYAVPLPVAVFLLVVWLVHVRHRGDRYGTVAVTAFPVAAAVVLVTPFLGVPVHLTALVLGLLVAVVQVVKSR